MAPILLELKWPSVDDLVTERDVAIMHWLLFHDQLPAILRKRVMCRGDVSVRETRATDASQLQLPRVRAEQARNFSFIEPLTNGAGLRLWLGRPAPHQGVAELRENG